MNFGSPALILVFRETNAAPESVECALRYVNISDMVRNGLVLVSYGVILRKLSRRGRVSPKLRMTSTGGLCWDRFRDPPRPYHLDETLEVGQLRNNMGFRGPHVGDNYDGPGTTEKQVEGLEEVSPRFFMPTAKLQLSASCGSGARTIRCCAAGSVTYTLSRPVRKQ